MQKRKIQDLTPFFYPKKEFEAAEEAEKNAIETATGYKEVAVIEQSLDAEEDFNKAQQVQAE